MKRFLIAASLALSLGTVGGAALPAHAGGFFADTFVRPFDPGLADQLDDANRRLGKPFDHAMAALSNYVIPGSGVMLEGAWTAQDIRNAWQNGELSDEDAADALAQVGEALLQ